MAKRYCMFIVDCEKIMWLMRQPGSIQIVMNVTWHKRSHVEVCAMLSITFWTTYTINFQKLLDANNCVSRAIEIRNVQKDLFKCCYPCWVSDCMSYMYMVGVHILTARIQAFQIIWNMHPRKKLIWYCIWFYVYSTCTCLEPLMITWENW